MVFWLKNPSSLILTVLKYIMQNLYCFLASRILQLGKYEITSCGWEGRRKEKLFLSDVISQKANWWWNGWIKDNRASICGFIFFPNHLQHFLVGNVPFFSHLKENNSSKAKTQVKFSLCLYQFDGAFVETLNSKNNTPSDYILWSSACNNLL